MRLLAFTVKNFGSIGEISLNDLPQLAILVGRNGAGKTFVFNALQLFFDEFQLLGGQSSAASDNYLWHRRQSSRDPSISVQLGLSEAEFRELATLSGFSDEETAADVRAGALNLTATRSLLYGKGWATKSIQLGSKILVQDDKIGPATPSTPAPDLSQWRLVLFDEGASRTKITGNRLLVNNATKQAFTSSPDFDSLVSSHRLAVSDKFKGQDYTQWTAAQGLTLNPSLPTPEQAKELHEAIAHAKEQARSREIAQAFVDKVRLQFKMIPAARDARESARFRAPLMDQADAQAMTQLSVNREPANEAKWGGLRTAVEASLSKRLEPNPEQVLALDKELRLPLANLGAGEQALISLEWHLSSGASIYAIEDPETHLHPDLAKKAFHLLSQTSGQFQVIASTHSPFFIAKQDPASNWRVFIDGDATSVSRCQSEADVKALLLELGVVPSDLMYHDLVVFLEGSTERDAVIPIWAEKLGVSLRGDLRVGLITVGGESRLPDNLRIWLEVAQHSPTDYLVLLDAHAASLASEIHNEMGIPLDKFIILPQHAIEDYYPPRHIAEALKTLYGLEVDPKDLYKKEGESRANTIRQILEQNNVPLKGWKPSVGALVASLMKPNEIDDSIKRAIDRIAQALH